MSRWYMYYTASGNNSNDHRLHVLKGLKSVQISTERRLTGDRQGVQNHGLNTPIWRS